jgi:uncharacterized protein (DUF302 family)
VTSINFKREISDTVDHAIERVTKALGAEGFGILTRIDMHAKIKDKTGKVIAPTVILGACNPTLRTRPTRRTAMSQACCHAMR